MPMQAESLEVLDQAAVPPAQARAIVRAIEIEIAGAKDTLATKHDNLLLRQEINAAEGRLRAETVKQEARIVQQIAETAGTLRSEIHASAGALRSEMHASAGALRAEIHASASSVMRQMYVALLGQMAVLLGVLYFFSTQLAR